MEEVKTRIWRHVLLFAEHGILRSRDFDSKIQLRSPATISNFPTENILRSLKDDSLQRFQIQFGTLAVGDEPDYLISRNMLYVMDEDDQHMFDIIQNWRNSAATLLLEHNWNRMDIELGLLGASIPRPTEIPSDVKLMDVLVSDPMNRFTLKRKPGNMSMVLVSRNLTNHEKESVVEEWLQSILDYLSTIGNRSASLGDIGMMIARPRLLPNSAKLLETLRTDPYDRFEVTGMGNDLRVRKRIKLSEAEFDQLVEIWKSNIIDVLILKRKVTLTELGSSAKRPVKLPKDYKLHEILRCDGLKRFWVEGFGDAIMVSLSKEFKR